MIKILNDEELKNNSLKIISLYKLCDYCIGRLFTRIEQGENNRIKGEKIRNFYYIEKQYPESNCGLCFGLVTQFQHFSNLVLSELKDYEYETFLIGTKIDEDIKERENVIMKILNNDFGESIKILFIYYFINSFFKFWDFGWFFNVILS